MMGRLSLLGIKPLFLIGGATGLIGDPSGKSKERVLLDEKVVEKNITSIQSELGKIYANIQNDLSKHEQEYELNKQGLENSINNSFKIRNNYEFYHNMDAVRYLRDVGKYFRMGPLLSR
jgi:tyrosyl-tRNA synthetase